VRAGQSDELGSCSRQLVECGCGGHDGPEPFGGSSVEGSDAVLADVHDQVGVRLGRGRVPGEPDLEGHDDAEAEAACLVGAIEPCVGAVVEVDEGGFLAGGLQVVGGVLGWFEPVGLRGWLEAVVEGVLDAAAEGDEALDAAHGVAGAERCGRVLDLVDLQLDPDGVSVEAAAGQLGLELVRSCARVLPCFAARTASIASLRARDLRHAVAKLGRSRVRPSGRSQ